MSPSGFEILYEQGPCLAVSKPGGVLTQAPPGIDSLAVRVKSFLKQRDNKTGDVYLGVPHRLDRPASGAMLLAKHVRAARRLAEQFEGRLVTKTYWAFVEGHVLEDHGTWHDWLRKIPNIARAEICDEIDAGSREAILHHFVLARTERGTLLNIVLETGRTHQIRVQASSRGFPLVGDSIYGASSVFGPTVNDPRERWIALHAKSLTFQHPVSRASQTVSAPLPDYWNQLKLPRP